MGKKNPFVATLEGTVERLAKAKPKKAYEILDEAFLVFAAAGDVEHAGALIRLVYGGTLPRPTERIHALGTGAMDGLCAAAKLGDLTKGEPTVAHLASTRTLAERVRVSDAVARDRLTEDAYTQFRKPRASWKELSGRELYRKAQLLARPGANGSPPSSEGEALAALTKYMDAWCTDPDDRGAGYGQEVALAFDLALRHGGRERVARWLPILGPHLLAWGIQEALCLPTLAKSIASGLLAPLVALSKDEAKTLHGAIERAAAALAAGATKEKATSVVKAPGKPARRTVYAEYSQFYLEHAISPAKEVFFQDERESAQGMSIFATKVGIATPTETGDCAVELALAKGKPGAEELADAVQAVSFPFVVKGPLFVRSVSGGEDDEDRDVVLPNGAYDVLARFFPKRAPKGDAAAGLRAFKVTLDFYPSGTLGAPKCFKLEYGTPPKKLFLNR